MHSKEFEKELKQLDERFSVMDNPNRPGLSNIFFQGMNYDLPVIPTEDLRDVADPEYRYQFPNGMQARFWSKPEVMARIHDFLSKEKAGQFTDYHDE